MTVQNQIVRNRYVGNGTTTVFPFTFDIDTSHPEYIYVYTLIDGKQEQTTNYTLDMDNKQITYPKSGEPLVEGGVLVIVREYPYQQSLNLVNQGPYFAEDIEQTFDDETYMIQQLADKAARTLQIAVTSSTDVSTELPIPEAGKAFGWNDDGTAIINIDNPQDVYYETQKIKEETQAISDETQQIKDDAQSQTQAAVQQAQDILNATQGVREDTQALYDETSQQRQYAENAADEANTAADKAKALAAEAKVYDSGTTYNPGDAVMVDSGEVYRCIATSTGESPITSSKWTLVSMVSQDTFEQDENGDLMPLYTPHSSSQFVVDEEGDIMPAV